LTRFLPIRSGLPDGSFCRTRRIQIVVAREATQFAGRPELGREPMNPEWLADFRFDTHSGLKSDIA